MILGIDEAGRGPWAGPLVVGAVVLGGAVIEGLTDSKKLSKKKRESLYIEVTERAVGYSSGWVTAAELDEYGMSEALCLATRRAVEQIRVPYSEIIIDGTVNFLAETGKGAYVTVMPKADLLLPSVSAASIIAKVERDHYMASLDENYPQYGFGAHAGYGVAKHRAAIAGHGITPEHRVSFAPLKKYQLATSEDNTKVNALMKRTTKEIGTAAESTVAEYLERNGHYILERNWRTKLCEIDLVSRKKGTVYFTEVKHRKNDTAGDGLAMVTAKKIRQMELAARMYAHCNRLSGLDLLLAAAATTGDPPFVTDYIELV